MTSVPATPAARLTRALERSPGWRRPALCPFLTAGFPSREVFASALRSVAEIADAVEIGVPFSDPMADGVTLQRASRAALAGGVTLRWILDLLVDLPPLPAPLVLMSYLNPLLAFSPGGLGELAERSLASGIAGFVVPDLPLEESASFRSELEKRGLALVQMVTPATPPDRLRELCRRSSGIVYAVTLTGTTGAAAIPHDSCAYLKCVREHSPIPVLAGFGIRDASQVRSLGREVDGVIVGSALVEEMERGGDPVRFLRSLLGGRAGEEEE
jgi:tryptophan synthase alpha chain